MENTEATAKGTEMQHHKFIPAIHNDKCQFRLDGWNSCLKTADDPVHETVVYLNDDDDDTDGMDPRFIATQAAR